MREHEFEVKRIALVGAGGVGKTTLLKLFEARGYAIFPSVARKFYEMQGIKDETEYMRMEVYDKLDFQFAMRQYFKQTYVDFGAANPGRNIATDRSLFDHLAYGIYGLEGAHSTESITSVIEECKEFSNFAYTHLVYIPYPQPWMKGISIEDGFRNTDASKNYAIAAMQYHAIHFEKAFNRLDCSLIVLDRTDRRPPEIFGSIQQFLGDDSLTEVVGSG
jgi:predicted ATPase